MSDYNRGNWIETYTGQCFYPLDPRVEEIDIHDIAHSLSMLCRFNGHCTHYYSIAEHCVKCVEYIQAMNGWRSAKDNNMFFASDMLLYILLHDAAEAYISDIPRPIKVMLPDVKKMENIILHIIYYKFGIADLPKQVDDACQELKQSLQCESDFYMEYVKNLSELGVEKFVKKVDLDLLSVEAKQLGNNQYDDWDISNEAPHKRVLIECWEPMEARNQFLKKFHEITGEFR